MWDKLQAERRTGAGNVVGDVATKGGLRTDVEPEPRSGG